MQPTWHMNMLAGGFKCCSWVVGLVFAQFAHFLLTDIAERY
jgi:hypothetical protein